MEVLGQWKQGIVYPRWAALAHWGYGEARFLFYPPASWTLGAALGAIFPWKIVPGVYCWIALVLASAAMYRLARQWLPVPDALFAAVFYALNPYLLVVIYWRSAYAELLAAALLPLLLLYLLRISVLRTGESGLRPTLGLGLTLAAAWLINIPAAIMIHYSAAGLVLLLAAIGIGRERASPERVSPERSLLERVLNPQTWRLPIHVAMAMLLGAGLASFYLLPAIYEQRWIDVGQLLSPGVRPQDNFLFTFTADPDHNRFNFLISTIGLCETGVLACAMWFSLRRSFLSPSRLTAPDSRGWLSPRDELCPRRSLWMLLAVWGTGSALLILAISNFLWRHLPKLRFVQLPFRWLLCLNAALAILLAMAAKRWTSRCLLTVGLLAGMIFAGDRMQPVYWDTASDIREMSDAIADGSGYEGTDEYVPAGADPYELNKDLPRISDEAGVPVPTKILAWAETEKHFLVHAPTPETLQVRLFNYPAWQVIVNGRPSETQTTAVTGLIVIPVAAGDNDVYIHFRRTTDRLLGDIVSLMSCAVFVVIWIRLRTEERSRRKT